MLDSALEDLYPAIGDLVSRIARPGERFRVAYLQHPGMSIWVIAQSRHPKDQLVMTLPTVGVLRRTDKLKDRKAWTFSMAWVGFLIRPRHIPWSSPKVTLATKHDSATAIKSCLDHW